MFELVSNLPHKCTPVIHNLGVTPMTAVISVLIAATVAGVIGYFIGKRGLTGTKTDLVNAEHKVTEVVDAAKTVA